MSVLVVADNCVFTGSYVNSLHIITKIAVIWAWRRMRPSRGRSRHGRLSAHEWPRSRGWEVCSTATSGAKRRESAFRPYGKCPPGKLPEAQCNAAASIVCCQDWAILCLITLLPANLVRNPIRKPRGATKAITG